MSHFTRITLIILVTAILSWSLFVLLKQAPNYLLDSNLSLSDFEKSNTISSIRTTIIQFAAFIGAIVTLQIAYLRVRAMEKRNMLQDKALEQVREQISQTEKQLLLAQGQQVNERFAKAAELLGSNDDNIGSRLGGIFSLERIAKEDSTYYKQIMEVLKAVRRNNQRALRRITFRLLKFI